MLNAMESISSGVTRGTSEIGVSRPSTRKYGWLPTFRCKSEDLFSTARRNRSSMLNAMCGLPAKTQLLHEPSTAHRPQQPACTPTLRLSYLSLGTGLHSARHPPRRNSHRQIVGKVSTRKTGRL